MVEIIGELREFAFDMSDEKKAIRIREMKAAGWLLCDGSEYNVKSLPKLYDSIGSSWGASAPKISFRVPDLRGVFVRGWNGDKNSTGHLGRDPEATARLPIYSGGIAGSAVGSFQDFATARPTKNLTGDTGVAGKHDHASGVAVATEHIQAGGALYMCNFGRTSTDGDHYHSVEIKGGGDVETRPLNVAVVYFIFAGEDAHKALPVA
jgi:microcystin-dependent protein